MKVAGWSDIVGSTFTLELERKSATEWIAKVPADYKIDPGAAPKLS